MTSKEWTSQTLAEHIITNQNPGGHRPDAWARVLAGYLQFGSISTELFNNTASHLRQEAGDQAAEFDEVLTSILSD